MSREDKELTQEELEAQAGETLPAREVMSLLTTNPGLVVIPEDPGTFTEPDPEAPAPPPRYDV